MICVSIQNKGFDEILDILDNETIQMAEIRLDRCPLCLEEIEDLFSFSSVPLVATCRVAGDGSGTWEEAEGKLMAAIKGGASFVDLEIEAPQNIGKRLRRECSDYGVEMIRSCHFFNETPSLETLEETARRCAKYGGDIVKIAVTAISKEDVGRVMSLYDSVQGRLIAFAMGEAGKESRLDCLRKGAPFTYAALTENEAAAPGQWPYREMTEVIYGDRNPFRTEEPVKMPASKSFAQRAIIAASLAEGTSILRGYSPCGDSEAALDVARQFGAEISFEDENTLTIKGKGPSSGDINEINVGESGLLTRLSIPILASRGNKPVRIDGKGTLLNRPLKGAAEIMARFGTVLRPENPGEVKVPLSVRGPLIPGHAEVSGKDGSQLISGLLMALPMGQDDSSLTVREPKSIPYLLITCDVLKHFGVNMESRVEADEDFGMTPDWGNCKALKFKIKGSQEYKAADIVLEGDWSAAANFMTAGAIFGEATLAGLDPKSIQADMSIMDILAEAGACITETETEFRDTVTGVTAGNAGTLITTRKAPLRAFDANLGNCPDLFPIVSVLAAFCDGESHIQGFKRLAGKESDRGKAIMDMLTQFGVQARSEDDTLTVNGLSYERRLLEGKLLKGGEFTSSHDHRMAMALSVAALGADGTVTIDDRDCVAKSFPGFNEIWKPFINDKQ